MDSGKKICRENFLWKGITLLQDDRYWIKLTFKTNSAQNGYAKLQI